MPTLFKEDGCRYYLYSNETANPVHVHVDLQEFSAKIWLNPVEVSMNHGFSQQAIQDIQRAVERHRDRLLEAWNEHFGVGG